MPPSVVHFVSLFATLVAIINPLEAIPVFLNLLDGKDQQVRRNVARKACLYVLGLMLFFLLFGTLLLRITGFFVSAMGMGLLFNGVVVFLETYGVVANHLAGQ